MPLFAFHACFFVGSADRGVVAYRARTGLGSGRQEAALDCVRNGLEHASQPLACFGHDRNCDLRELAALCAVIKIAGFHGLAEKLFGGERVEERLENRSSSHILRTILKSLTGFVIDYSKHVTGRIAFDQIDGAAHANAIENNGFRRRAVNVVALIGAESESEFKMSREPTGTGRSHLLDPAAQVRAHFFDLALPDTRNRG